MNFKQIRTVVMAFWREFREDNVQGLAAQVAFHLLFSIVPLLIFLAALSGFISRQVGIDDAMVEVRQWLAARLPSESREAVINPIEEMLTRSAGGLLSFGAVTALWGGRNAVAAMMEALNVAYDVKEERPWWRQQVVALGLTILLGLAGVTASGLLLLSSGLGEEAADAIGLGDLWGGAWRWLQLPLIVAVLVGVLMMLYWAAPDTELRLKEMWPGAVATVVLWGLAAVGLSIYFANFAGYLGAAYGALGGVLAFLFFLYVMSMMTIIGGEINAGFLRGREVQAVPGEVGEALEAENDEDTRIESGSAQESDEERERRG